MIIINIFISYDVFHTGDDKQYTVELNVEPIEMEDEEETDGTEILRRIIELDYDEYRQLFEHFYGRINWNEQIYFTTEKDLFDFIRYVKETYRELLEGQTEETLNALGLKFKNE